MKKMFLFLGVIFMTTFFFCSCQPTSKENESPYKLNIYGNSYNLTQAILWEGNPNSTYLKKEYVWEDVYVGEEGEEIIDKVVGFEKGEQVSSGNFRLNLFDDGITFMSSTNTFIGAGTVVSIHFASELLTELKPGKYTCSSDKTAGTFMGYLATNYEFNGKNQQIISITEGDANVEKLSGGYKITINAKTAAGISFTANFEGKLDPIKEQQSKVVNISSLYLGSLLDEIFVKSYVMGVFDSEGFETDAYTTGCLSISAGEVSAIASDPDGNVNTHIAAAFDKVTNNIVLISPIKVQSVVGHEPDYYYACHTRYKMADGMTEEQFQKFDGSTMPTFSDDDPKVLFSSTDFQPGYFYFEAGDGTAGLVRVNGLEPRTNKSTFLWGVFEMRYTIEGQLLMDVKATTNYGNPKI